MPTTDLFVIDDAARQHEMMISMGEKGNLCSCAILNKMPLAKRKIVISRT